MADKIREIETEVYPEKYFILKIYHVNTDSLYGVYITDNIGLTIFNGSEKEFKTSNENGYTVRSKVFEYGRFGDADEYNIQLTREDSQDIKRLYFRNKRISSDWTESFTYNPGTVLIEYPLQVGDVIEISDSKI